MRVFLLVGEPPPPFPAEPPPEGNLPFLAGAFAERGDEVWLASIDSLSLAGEGVLAAGHACTGESRPALRPTDAALRPLADADLVWVLSLGRRDSFLDKMQLLALLERRVRVVNSVQSLLHLKSKYALSVAATGFRHPPTSASADWRTLWRELQSSGEDWVAKSPAGSFGRNVFRLHRSDVNARAILQTLTDRGRYALLQRYLPEIAEGEMRVLLAGGRVIGQYRRFATLDHRTNLMQGGTAAPARLNARQQAGCARLGAWLLARGADFCGVDLVGDWLLECNVVNPGGLATLKKLTGEDHSVAVLDAVIGSTPPRDVAES